jgi:hypothetical protein
VVFFKHMRRVEAHLQTGLERKLDALVRRWDQPWPNRHPMLMMLLGLLAGVLSFAAFLLLAPS